MFFLYATCSKFMCLLLKICLVFHIQSCKIYKNFTNLYKIVMAYFLKLEHQIIIENMLLVGPGSLTVSLITAFFVSIVFTLQIAKEFLYLNASSLIGSILTISFIRELSPVLTSVIIIGRIGSCFTAELATMKVTEQIDALYLLSTDPLWYLVFPRVIACVFMLPMLSFLSFVTSIASSAFICFILYSVDPLIFLSSSFSSLLFSDIVKSFLKTVIFGFTIAFTSCYWGLLAKGGAKGVGKFTTTSVVTSLLLIFILDFILSYYMFDKLDSSIKNL
uniref:Conserved hypothetical plastid protein n=1 Tax=Caulacanthus okamurae TaxID=152008 RepID=A0A6H1U8J5_9FLOR|nr:conserved hypothetical plastid protein [Caulacanthus okamurae]QIZ74766.1 conserved hypothetical plastid protein [Caulacanthus okamurae]